MLLINRRGFLGLSPRSVGCVLPAEYRKGDAIANVGFFQLVLDPVVKRDRVEVGRENWTGSNPYGTPTRPLQYAVGGPGLAKLHSPCHPRQGPWTPPSLTDSQVPMAKRSRARSNARPNTSHAIHN